MKKTKVLIPLFFAVLCWILIIWLCMYPQEDMRIIYRPHKMQKEYKVTVDPDRLRYEQEMIKLQLHGMAAADSICNSVIVNTSLEILNTYPYEHSKITE